MISFLSLIAGIALILAAFPAVLLLINLILYRTLPKLAPSDPLPSHGVSVLIPARDEERNIAAALESVCSSLGVDLEVVVLDDHSSDRTAAIVEEVATRDPRIRLVQGAPLLEGWCGKNFACQQLAEAARNPFLVFMDADVRIIDPHGIARLASWMASGESRALASGVPRQITVGWMEKAIVPLIHFVLLAYLPLAAMRRSRDPRFAASCGQFLAVDRQKYLDAGGHGAVRNRIHDAMALTRTMRAAGNATDLFDATDVAQCRMYERSADVWRGFAKNAHEGLAAPGVRGPMGTFLLGGQVLPYLLLAALPVADATACTLIFTAVGLSLLTRLALALRFHQSFIAALLHPFGVLLLVANQWHGWHLHTNGRPVAWKQRVQTSL